MNGNEKSKVHGAEQSKPSKVLHVSVQVAADGLVLSDTVRREPGFLTFCKGSGKSLYVTSSFEGANADVVEVSHRASHKA